MRDGKAAYATVLLLLAIGGLMVFAGTLLLYKNKRYRLLWLAALVFYGSVGSLGYDLVFGGDMELLMWGTVALLLGVLGGGLALVREKPAV